MLVGSGLDLGQFLIVFFPSCKALPLVMRHPSAPFRHEPCHATSFRDTALAMLTPTPSPGVPALDDPHRRWLQRLVRTTLHPEWGTAHVVRWFPAHDGAPERLRIFVQTLHTQKVVAVTEVETI